ncbi:MAG TPA: anti-sigma factor [Rhodocyclaceae bacterium]|nr:anti-sigma factor [Rhodocyclaceae bacterium]
MNAPINEADLHAWADGQLGTERRAHVEAWLAGHPEARALAEGWREQNRALHRAYDHVLDQPVPARLLEVARRRGGWLPRFSPMRAAAVVGWLALGGVAGYVAGHRAPAAPVQASLPRQAALAHLVYTPEVRHPVEVGADQEAHLAAWLSKRLGAPLKPPALGEAGYALVGGRLLPGEDVKGGGPVAQFMYQEASGRRLTLYVRNDAEKRTDDVAFRFAQEGKVGVFYWIDGPFGYALSGELAREELLRVATVVYKQSKP